MRDPKRIKPLLAALETYMTRYPDMRLGQIVVSLVQPASDDPFFVEDDVMLANLQARLGMRPVTK